MLCVKVKKRLGGERRTAFTLDLDFEAPTGVTALLGASGAGKTTTLRLIAGIITPDGGSIAVAGRVFFGSAKRVNLPIQRRRVGFAFQDYALFPHLTAEQNVVYGVRPDAARAKRERVMVMLALFRIGHVARRLPHELSGGEQQRVALARALVSDPVAVLLDEPLSAVDVKTRALLLDEIEAAQRAAQIPFLYVTQNSAEAERLASHSITVEQGRVVGHEKLKP